MSRQRLVKKSVVSLFQKRDLFLIVEVLLAALFCYLWTFPRESASCIVVEQDGQIISTISLSQVQEPYELEIGGPYPAVLLIEPDGVSFLSASCPDKRCVHSGKLTQAGQIAVCLPARLTVRLQGSDPSIDAYTG